MPRQDHQDVAVVIRIGSGDFETGFRVHFEIFNNGRPVGGRRDCPNIPANANLPRFYQEWSTAYQRLGSLRLGSNIPDEIPMAPIKPVDGQRTHYNAGEACKQATHKLESAIKEWFAHQDFQYLDALIKGEAIVHRDISIPVIFDIDTGNAINDDLLKKIPWHEWSLFRRTLPNAEAVLSTGRFQDVVPLTLPVKVLVVLGSNEGGLQLDDDEKEWSKLEKLGAELAIVKQPSLEELDNVLRSRPWDILFFGGHSTTQKDTLEDGYLQINDHDIIKLEVLDEALFQATQKGLKLAIFNSCDGLGLSNFLAKLAVPFSIVMREPVPDVIARDFLKNFLTEFSQGRFLYKAMREARSRLRFRMGDPRETYPCATWLPVLCQNPTQPELFWPTATHKPATIPDPPPEKLEQSSEKKKIPWLLVGGIAGLAAISAIGIPLVLRKPTIKEIPRVEQPIDSKTLDDAFSIGEEFLLNGSHSGIPQAAADAFRDGRYQEAITNFRRALSTNRNNPEYVIYLNNAIAHRSGKPMHTVAVSVPARYDSGQAQEVLRGVAQFQAENNCGLDVLVASIQDANIDLQCNTASQTVLQVLIIDHENRNDKEKILDRFSEIVADNKVLGLIGRYNSGMTFAVENAIREGEKLSIISTTSTAVRHGEVPSEMVFRTSPTDDITARKWRDYILEQADVKTLVILSDSQEDSQYSQSLRKEVFDAIPTTIKKTDCDLDDIDQCLLDIENTSVDAIILIPSDNVDYIRDALNFLQRYEAKLRDNLNQGLYPVLLGGDTLYDSDEVIQRVTKGSLLEQLLVTIPWHRGLTKTAFEQGAEKLWIDPINWRTIMGYDSTWLFTEAINNSPECSGNDIVACRKAIPNYLLENGLEDGATGKISFFPNGDRKEDADRSRVSVLVRVDVENRTFACLEGEHCSE